MKVLVSSPNLQGAPSRFCLSVFDLVTEKFSWVNAAAFIDRQTDLGTTGIAVLPDAVILAIQSPSRPRLVQLSSSLEFERTIEVPGLKDPHGLAVSDNSIYVASTGTNEIFAVDIATGTQWRHWAFEERTDRDVLHLSSIAVHGANVLVSTHNHPRRGADRQECGCVFDVTAGSVVLDGLERPHSLTSLGGQLYFLNSAAGGVLRVNERGCVDRGTKVGGFVRGIASLGDTLIVGSSSQRLHSRRLGVTSPNLPPGDEWISDRRFRSSLAIIDTASLEVRRRFDFTLMAPEIFDIAVLTAEPTPSVLLDDPEALRSASLRHEIWNLRLRADQQVEAIGALKGRMERRRLHNRAVLVFNGFAGGVLSGEAFDPDRPDAAVHVRALIDGQHAFYGRSDLSRARSANPELRRPRFSLPIPSSVLGGARHKIEIDVPDAVECEKVILDLHLPEVAHGAALGEAQMSEAT